MDATFVMLTYYYDNSDKCDAKLKSVGAGAL
jgi:hypothetical protein